MNDLKNMYQIKRHEKSRRIIYKIGVLNEKRCKTKTKQRKKQSDPLDPPPHAIDISKHTSSLFL